MESLHAPTRQLRALRGETIEENHIWALKDVRFEVQECEVLGIIGHNGAGKMTLLRLLAGLIKLDNGYINIRGIGPLIALGAGFNPISTGRESIFEIYGSERNFFPCFSCDVAP